MYQFNYHKPASLDEALTEVRKRYEIDVQDPGGAR